MQLTHKAYNRVDRLNVVGRVDRDSSTQLEQKLDELIENGRRNLIIDLSGVEFISSYGLRTLVTARKRCAQKRGRLVLLTPSERVTDVLAMSGLNSIFDSYDDPTDAVGSF